jgi:hypothetical protein
MTQVYHYHVWGGGSRLVWFALGSIATAWFLKRKQVRLAMTKGLCGECARHRHDRHQPERQHTHDLPGALNDCRDIFGSCSCITQPHAGVAAPAPPTQPTVVRAASTPKPLRQVVADWEELKPDELNSDTKSNITSPQQWDEETEQLRHFTRQTESKVGNQCLHTVIGINHPSSRW